MKPILLRSLILPTLLAGVLPAATTGPVPCASLPSFGDLLEAGECATGIFTVKNPDFDISGGKADPLEIGLDIPEFDGTISIGLSGPFLSFFANEPTIYQFALTVDPPPDVLFGFEASFEDFEQFGAQRSQAEIQAPGDGDIQLLFNLCAGGTFTGNNICSGDAYELLLDNTGPRSGRVLFRRPTNLVDIRMIFTLRNLASFDGIQTGVNTPMPEPGTMILIGSALLAFGLMHKRLPRYR